MACDAMRRAEAIDDGLLITGPREQLMMRFKRTTPPRPAEPTLQFDLLIPVEKPTAATRWIADGTHAGRDITSAIPPVFGAYATITHEYDEGWGGGSHERNMLRDRVDALLPHLKSVSGDSDIWFGFRRDAAYQIGHEEREIDDIYAPGWLYQFATGRLDAIAPGLLPELVWPADRSWLLSNLWDDDWTCVGGSTGFIQALEDDPTLMARRVQLGQDAIPPRTHGHVVHRDGSSHGLRFDDERVTTALAQLGDQHRHY